MMEHGTGPPEGMNGAGATGGSSTCSRLPLHGSNPATGARRLQVEERFLSLLVLRRLFDDLTKDSGDELSWADVAHLACGASDRYADEAQSTVRPLEAARPQLPEPSATICATDGSVRIAAAIQAYMKDRRQLHVGFGEFGLLCRQASVRV